MCAFAADGRHLAVQPADKPQYLRPLPSFAAPADEVPGIVRLLTGEEIDATDGIVGLDDDECRRQWPAYRRAYLALRAAAAGPRE